MQAANSGGSSDVYQRGDQRGLLLLNEWHWLGVEQHNPPTNTTTVAGQAQLGLAQLGLAWLSSARLSSARLGAAALAPDAQGRDNPVAS
jgi:hypothetical protein